MSKTRLRRVGTVAALGAALFAGALTVAPTASAVGSSACAKNVTNHWRHIDVLASQGAYDSYMHSGPGETYKVVKGLGYGDDFKAYCGGYSSHGNWWYYSKLPNGKKGWIFGRDSSKGRF
ncbi:SH3 domain-containing protein [Streptomyces cucumeris]|uniref:SH3 domain-containing protein n=1 Tax=Streptomyces cucumeris TaxID=2962890 RepID=UPI0020C9195A|nr:SH3 domain-containing protein [Streptomyces sp. NEAU-Y11]MCP9207494.1 SH3 domain-containing protein [Streptomyces sp. NEAU-Y11]